MTFYPRFPGVILSGGRSSRMGEPKALLPFGRGRLIDHVASRLAPQVTRLAINTNDPAISLPGIPAFADLFTGFHGPLAGIHASLAHIAATDSTTTHIAIVPVDAPFFPTDLIARLAASLTGPDDVALTMSSDRWHPVMGLWPLSATRPLQQWLENPPTLKVRAFLEGLPVKTVAFPPIATSQGEVDPFFNVNAKSDLEWAQEIFDAATSD
jgi:molybdopterin-guanine dinucleotide biosynthesis protein A